MSKTAAQQYAELKRNKLNAARQAKLELAASRARRASVAKDDSIVPSASANTIGKRNMKKVPLYFNFVGSRRDMLDTAMESYDRVAGDLIDVRVHYSYRPRRFTECLNEILKINDEPYFFAHFDSVLTDRSAIENILAHEPGPAGLVAHCLIVDLLMLVVPKAVRSIGGWDEAYSNSCMDLDLQQRLHRSGQTMHIIHSDIEQGRGVDHFNASAARKDPAMRKVYGVTMQQDYDRYYDKYHNRSDPGYLHVCEYIKKEFGDG